MTRSTRTARRAAGAAAGVAACCIAALVTACGPARPPAASSTTRPASHSRAASQAATPAAGSASTPAASSAPPASTPGTQAAGPATAACLSRYLRADPGDSQGTAGSVYVEIEFTNLDNQPCTLYGYPGVSFGSATPVRQVGPAATENPSPPRELVTLQPGGMAKALLQIADAGNYSAAQCHPVATPWLQVYPPNQTVPLYVHYSTTACAGPVRLLTVSVVQPGSGSSAS